MSRWKTWLVVAGCAIGGVLLAGVGAFIGMEVIDGAERLCQ